MEAAVTVWFLSFEGNTLHFGNYLRKVALRSQSMPTSSVFPGHYPFNLLEILCFIKVSAGQAQPDKRGQVFILLLAPLARQPNAKLEEQVRGLFLPQPCCTVI